MSDHPSPEQRRELGAFLSSRRARLQPTDFGLPAGPRRTPGLRREEVALLAGVSVSWYTWLEQGREIHPSADALRRIGDVLRLDQAEAAHLFALAARQPPPPPAGNGPVSDGLEQLVRAIDVPAYVRNTRLDILVWNAAVADLFVDYAALQPHERNTLRLLFLHEPFRTRIVDWAQMARSMLSTFRAARAQAQDKAPFDALVAELSDLSPEFSAWWGDTDVKIFDEGGKILRLPGGAQVAYTYLALTPVGRPDLSLVTYMPREPAWERHS
ncbi:helix-turn-helix protein [Pseudoduganella lurida]|uniref:Helix-turn-helix protein n=1 Tax=Pseudoduganella lurida TaxID=1036180 RepID=A0A562R342_9BURK|nr:helix-turn-helix transcriptional regulator [Pseudoduganella lurida]TWI63505.1 helix-turn-helix protein [Pseudoduganella lurida]